MREHVDDARAVHAGAWLYSTDHGQLCQVIEVHLLWGETTCTVWLPESNAVARVAAAGLQPVEAANGDSVHEIAYVAAAARVADALTQDVLLAPIEASVIPLPHQIRALSRAMSGGRVRYLLADEVGLGKTIEAGLIMRELKLRGLVQRTLVVAPKGLVTQWVSEMSFHFGETFQLVLPEDIRTLNRLIPALGADDTGSSEAGDGNARNAWRLFDQVVVPVDSVKPVAQRRGWTTQQTEEYNRDRFDDLTAAGWDLIIVDEAHRLGGSTDQVARYKLGQGLAEAAPYLLLLTATPHQGKTDAFHRLISLLDPEEFPDTTSVTRDRVRPHVIRTEKRGAIDADGNPLFKPRHTHLAPVSWQDRHEGQRLLYEAVTEYVREGYNQAIKEKKSYIGFLMILMQRLVVSSTRAIRATLVKRLSVLEEPEQQLTLFPVASDEEWADLDGQGQVDMLLSSRIKALKNEREEVRLLLQAAARCERAGPDAKAEALLDWLYRLQAEEGETDLKTLVFTEFIPTQEMLREFLTERGFSVVCLNGAMEMEERRRVQEEFAGDARILISTDAGGEGINLQFCHVVINYDIPWNPMKLEQRIGRVDRIGQSHTVRAVNLVFEGSVEQRVREVLEEKLSIIFEEFGIDKTGDVLDAAQAGRMFDDVYVEAVINPDRVEEAVDRAVAELQEEVRQARATVSLLGVSEDLGPDEAQGVMAHPLPHWVERMTVSYLRARGGHAEMVGETWRLDWPDGTASPKAVFTSRQAEMVSGARHLTLEDPMVRALATRLPRCVVGQRVPVAAVPGIAAEIQGIWSLWRIAIASPRGDRERTMALFLADGGQVFMPTARRIWDQLLANDVEISNMLSGQDAVSVFERAEAAAQEQGRSVYDELVEEHRAQAAREMEKLDYSFAARRRAVERIGLPEVREHRMAILAEEERAAREKLEQTATAYPEMMPLLLLRVEGGP